MTEKYLNHKPNKKMFTFIDVNSFMFSQTPEENLLTSPGIKTKSYYKLDI